ncbi:MAG TPA: hypothetical protein VFJ14_06435 [Nocardioidaceae bacterium]|nr:hypothetical protein [Nocardioidaceae bacterium]
MEDADAPLRHFGDYPHGAYWSVDVPADDQEDESYEVSGTTITFMPDDSVTVPVWDEEGLLPEDPAWLHQVLGLSPELVADIATWGTEWNAAGTGSRHLPGMPDQAHPNRLDAEAHILAERLRAELPSAFTVLLRL